MSVLGQLEHKSAGLPACKETKLHASSLACETYGGNRHCLHGLGKDARALTCILLRSYTSMRRKRWLGESKRRCRPCSGRLRMRS